MTINKPLKPALFLLTLLLPQAVPRPAKGGRTQSQPADSSRNDEPTTAADDPVRPVLGKKGNQLNKRINNDTIPCKMNSKEDRLRTKK